MEFCAEINFPSRINGIPTSNNIKETIKIGLRRTCLVKYVQGSKNTLSLTLYAKFDFMWIISDNTRYFVLSSK